MVQWRSRLDAFIPHRSRRGPGFHFGNGAADARPGCERVAAAAELLRRSCRHRRAGPSSGG